MKKGLFFTVAACLALGVGPVLAQPKKTSEQDKPSMNLADYEKVGSVFRFCRHRTAKISEEKGGPAELHTWVACDIYRSKDYKGPMTIDLLPTTNK